MIQESSVKIGAWFMIGMGIYALITAVLWILMTEVAFVSDFGAYTGQPFSDYLISNPKPAELWLFTKRLIGIERLATSLLIIFITQKSYRKGEKWSWFALLIAGIITWGWLIGYRIAIGYAESTGIATPILGLALLFIGLAIPARAIMGQKSLD
jgi:hypothetical protein